MDKQALACGGLAVYTKFCTSPLAGDGRPVTVTSSKANPMVQASPFECWAVQFLRMSAHLLCLMCASRARWPVEIVQLPE